MADTRQQPSRFNQAEAAEIIREATTRSLSREHGDRELTREDLLAMAREMGVSESAVEQVLASRVQQQKYRRLRRIVLTTYTIVIGGLTVMDMMTGPNWWVQWPALGWGMGLALHASGVSLALLRKPDGR